MLLHKFLRTEDTSLSGIDLMRKRNQIDLFWKSGRICVRRLPHNYTKQSASMYTPQPGSTYTPGSPR